MWVTYSFAKKILILSQCGLFPSLFLRADLMTEMMDCSSDLVGSGIPFLDYRVYAERIFFPGHRESPLRRDLDVPECRRQTVEQGLVQLSNLLNSKLFLTKVTLTNSEEVNLIYRTSQYHSDYKTSAVIYNACTLCFTFSASLF